MGIPEVGVVSLGLALCIRGTLGKGTLHTYPSWRVPAHPFRMLGLVARGNTRGEFTSWR
jgi:hypothetical protein